MGTRSFRLIVFIVLCACVRLVSQSSSTGSSSFDIEKLMAGAQNKGALDAASRADQIPFDNVIQPQFYRLGPGDVLSFLKLDAASIEESIVVSPENLLFIPRLGAISVLGKTLSQTRDTILALQKQRTPNIALFVGLKRPRQVYVSIRGNVLSPGLYAVPASMRVQTLLKMAMQFKTTATEATSMRAAAQLLGQSESNNDLGALRQRSMLFPPSVLRNIIIHHSDRTSDLCDLQRAETTNSAVDDPYLREGDDIFVPTETSGLSTMSIAGGVAQSVTTIYKKGDKISFLLKLGGRCTNLAAAPRAFLVRGAEKKELHIDENLNLVDADIDAMPGDLILVDQEYLNSTSKFGAVTIKGEVGSQGVYAIEQNVTRLKQAIEMAGGLNTEAYLPLAYVLRRETSDAPLFGNEYTERLKKLQYSNLLLEDTVRFAIDEISRKPMVSCDFTRALSGSSNDDNIVLQDGDVIVVPKNPKSVFVYGQVRKAGYLQWVPGRTMEQYIAMAGGMTSEADKGRERIIKGKNGVWLKDLETTIEAGDKIYIPHPPDEPLGQQAQRTASNVSIATSIVNVLLSMINIYITLSRK